MKVISGMLKGRVIDGYDIEGTRPTQDRVKESVFSTIQNYVKDSIVLDLFAGTGNLGIEALSNYSKFCYFVDNNNKCIKLIDSNLKKFNVDNYKILNNDYKDALNYFKDKKTKFDLVFLDPPYKDDCINYILDFISSNDMLNEDGIVVCEAEFDTFKDNSYYKLIKDKRYGYKFVKIYRKKGCYE